MRQETKSIQQSLGVLAVAAACWSAVPPVEAGGGRTPLFQEGVLPAGNHVATRNIQSAGPVLQIASGSNYVIDLNGFTLETTGPGPVVSVVGSTQGTTVRIENGILLADDSAGEPIAFQSDAADIEIVDIDTNGSIVINDPLRIDIFRLTSPSLAVNGSAAKHVTGSIEEVELVDSDGVGFEINYGSAIRANGISIENPGDIGARINNTEASQFKNVTVENAGDTGVSVEASSTNSLFEWNIIGSSGDNVHVDGLSQGNVFTHITAGFAQNGNVGFRNEGSQTMIHGAMIHGNSGGGVLNTGSEMTVIGSTISGNAPPDLDDQGFLTNVYISYTGP